MQKWQLKYLKYVIITILIITIALNIFSINTRKQTIYIGTKNLTEQQIIANIYKYEIEDKTDYDVEIISGLDTTSFVNNALLQGDIDMYIEYTSNAYLDLFKHEFANQSKTEIANILEDDYDKIGLELNSFLGFENSNAIICMDFCNSYQNISDLDGKTFTFAAPAYFYERSDGYNLLEEKYDLSNVETIKADPVIIYQGVLSGQIDVGLGFTTDAKLATSDVTILNDADNVFPSYDAMLITEKNIEGTYPGIDAVFDEIAQSISTEDIQSLNYQVENDNNSAEQVAKEYVSENY